MLALDPRLGELDVHAKVVNHDIYLRGCVTTDQRREAIVHTVAELYPDYRVHDEIGVVHPVEGHGGEQLT